MWLWIYAVGITLIFLAFFFYEYKKRERRFFEYQDKMMSSQLEEINQIYMTMRGWRHDYHNHMQKIRAHLALKEYAEVDEYIDQMEQELKKIDLKYKSGHTGVDAILNSKLSLAENQGLKVKCDAMLPSDLSFPPVDLCVLLGNLIDNAIEACEKMDSSGNRFIRVYLCVRKKQLYISVCNATNEVVRKLDKEYISTKRGNHGHGLLRINQIVEKHQGYINRQNEPGAFVTEVMLPLYNRS